MKMKSIRLENHPGIGDVYLSFCDNLGDPFNVVVLAGGNGTGKTAVHGADAEDLTRWVEQNPDGVPPENVKKKHLARFANAFHAMFPNKRFKEVRHRAEGHTVEFEEFGRTTSIDKLNTGEKQVVFRAGFLLRNLAEVRSSIVLIDEPELTRLYNALEAHRAGRVPEQGRHDSMTPIEARDYMAASVVILAEHHAAVDRLTLAAYGWSDLEALPVAGREQALLGRLVALNADRRLEEARGQVRWLRPDYQAPRSRARASGVDDRQSDVEALLAPALRVSWPREPRPQLWLIRGALAEASAPLSAEALAARFKGRKAALEVPRLLSALERQGQVRATGDGYTLLRAA